MKGGAYSQQIEDSAEKRSFLYPHKNVACQAT